jgi:hypothetical protein
MKETIAQMKDEYHDFVQGLLAKGQLPAKDTGVGFWGPSSVDEVFQAFSHLDIKGSFIDLGSGDGRCVLAASLLCSHAVGVEYDPLLTLKAKEVQGKLDINNAIFHHDNFHNHDLSRYDYVFVNPDQPFHRGLQDKLIQELRGKRSVQSNHFLPSGLTLEKQFRINGTGFSVYTQ